MVCAAFGFQMAVAQVKEQAKTMSLGSKNALILEVPNAKVDYIIDEWKDFIKAEGKVKAARDKKNDEYFCDNASLPQLAGATASTVDVFAKVEEFGSDKSLLNVWVDMGGAFLNSYDHPAQYKEAQTLLNRFSVKVASDLIAIDVEKEEKKLKKQDGNLKDLARDNERFKKRIEEAKDAIKKAEADIITNEKDQATAKKEMEVQKSIVDKLRQKIDALKKI